MSERQRLFFALWPSARQQKDWAKVVEKPLSAIRGKPVPRRNLHVTLVFLGGLGSAQRQQLLARMMGVSVPRFELCFDYVGYSRRSKLLWWGVNQVPDALTELVASLELLARDEGVSVPRRRFRPHMTLMRHLGESPGKIALPPQTWAVEQFALLRSQLLPQGARYEVLQRYQLT